MTASAPLTDRDFLGGVVEGFYGQPWTQRQRFVLLEQMRKWGLNTYFYAPKDDLKHRALWRREYDPSELAAIGELIDACRANGIVFVYGLSPGLDMQFSEASEIAAIEARFAQLQERQCAHFALLFDDLPDVLRAEDHRRFGSLASAHCAVANAVLPMVRRKTPRARFLFCPTPYCGRMDRSEHGGRGYLDTVGRQLDEAIDVLWTGPEIVSREIPVESLRELTSRIGRPPILWDNLHANDYDYRRIYCGPFSGRGLEIRQAVRGIVLNPNNEFSVNYIPLRTFAAYLQNDRRFGGDDGNYDARRAFLAAAAEWLVCYEGVGPALSLDDLILLADCFYLPYEEGAEGEKLFATIQRLVCEPPGAWGDAYRAFQQYDARIQAAFVRLTELQDRELFYGWSRRAWELKEELALLHEYFRGKLADVDLVVFESENLLPGTYRGGLLARLQRLLPMDEEGRLARR